MYRFSYVENVSAPAQDMSRELFHQLISRPQVQRTCQQIRDLVAKFSKGENTKELQNRINLLKKNLPAFCWHASFPQGKRRNDAAVPSFLIMIDIDHEPEPVNLFKKLKEHAEELGLVAAHITPSTQGLRLVFPQPEGMNLEEAQHFLANELGVQIDVCTKDLARLSFCVPESYWLFVDEEKLFSGEVVSQGRFSDPSNSPSMCRSENRPYDTPTFDETYDHLPYSYIVQALCDLLGGAPAHGSRNNFIFSMAAYLRYICNDDPRWIAHILPTYGESEEKWRRTIESACQRAQYKVMPNVMKRAIEQAKQQFAFQTQEREQEIPPAMPAKLPKLIRHLIKNVPLVCKPAVANAVFPALGAHLKDVKFWLIDGTLKEATFMCVTVAPQSSGKASVNKPIEYIMADIVEQDNRNRQREQEWKDAVKQKGDKSTKPKRPEKLCIQLISSDLTNAAFTQRMMDADGHYLYCNLEELELLRQLQTNGMKDIGKIICLCFDNGMYGQERVGIQSVTARVKLRWNWNASSTIQKCINFFKGRLVDGTLSRVNFCTIFPDKRKPFKYGKYDEQYAEELKPFIQNLNLASGVIDCKPALRMAQQMLDECQEEGALSDDDTYQDLAYRAVTIAYLKAMVLYIADDYKWSREIAEFARWSLKYDLWCKCHFFGEQISSEKEKENVKPMHIRKNLLDLLKNSFTLNDAKEMRRIQGLSEDPRQMLSTWLFRGYIEQDRALGLYIKTDKRKMKTA